MKIIVFGGSSLVGYHIAQKISTEYEVISTYNNNQIIPNNCVSSKIDILNHESTSKLISQFKPELIVDTVAFPNVDKCETDPELTYRINVKSVEDIVKSCKGLNPKIVFISTSFVFGDNTRVYTETDTPIPNNNYGRQKLQCEKIIEESNLPHLILRTDQIYGWSKKGQRQSFVNNVLNKLRDKEKIDVCIDWYNNPTHVEDIADCINILIKKEKTGVYHLVGGSYLNRYEWGIKIARKFNYDEKLVNSIESTVLNLPAKRPNCNLNNSKIFHDTGFHMKNVDEGLDFMYQFRETET